MQDLQKTETWKPVENYPNYLVSDWGRIKSVDRSTYSHRHGKAIKWKGRFLKPSILEGRYPIVSLSRCGKTTSFTVHSLVAQAFLGPRPEGLRVLHYDDVGRNNHVHNLRYGTQQENYWDAERNRTLRAYTGGSNV
ncbi:MAG: hypothetical protein DRI57_09845 [Deltaproteobacteria bacterium]|nr:MAG: hypothetical protein DRI57_09845 [Deltaproteobacteria bacterium]